MFTAWGYLSLIVASLIFHFLSFPYNLHAEGTICNTTLMIKWECPIESAMKNLFFRLSHTRIYLKDCFRYFRLYRMGARNTKRLIMWPYMYPVNLKNFNFSIWKTSIFIFLVQQGDQIMNIMMLSYN